MRWSMICTMILVAGLGLAASPGCTQADENPGWNPSGDLPAWTYDAPWYYRPTEELVAQETIGDGIPIYYTSDGNVFLAHPQGAQITGVPRIGVWVSYDQGCSWQRAGFFGVEQTHFLLRPENDGPVWVRFTGPEQGST